MVMEPQAPGPVASDSSTSKTVPDPRINQLTPLDSSSTAMQSSSPAVPSAPQSKSVIVDASGAPVKPNSHSLGCEFVRQYYTMLNKAPGSVHRFYSEDSSFIHGSLNESIQSEPVYGQNKINELIMALNFKDCHAKIVQVDSLETVGKGFVIQVTGELSNDGQPLRHFFQTFVLVPRGPNNYYVRNDIFRYQDEVFADEEEVSEADEAEVVRSSAPVATSNTVADSVGSASLTAPSSAAAAIVTADSASSNMSSDATAKLTREEERGITEKPAVVSNIVDKSPKGSVKVNGFQEQKSPSTGAHGSSNQQQQSSSVAPQQQQQKSNKASSQAVAPGINSTSVTPETTNATVVSSSPSSAVQSEKAPVSWAAKVARDTMKPSSDVPSNAGVTLVPSPKASKEQPQQTHNTSPAGQQPQQQQHHHHHHQQHQQQQSHQHQPQQPHQHNQQHPQALNQQHNAAHQSHPHLSQSGRKGGDRIARTPKVEKDESNTLNEGDSVGNENNHEVIKKVSPYNDEQQVFVGNLPLDIKEDDLKNFFSKFGNILDVRINRTNQTSGSGRTPNYGFVTFDDAKIVRNILSQKPIYFNEHRFNVEEKRSQGRGSALNRSASGATLGVNKGTNQQHNPQQNSQQARRERRERFPFQGNRETGPRRNQAGVASSGAPAMAGQARPVFQPKR